jgi:arylsulfatase A-like enzyme
VTDPHGAISRRSRRIAFLLLLLTSAGACRGGSKQPVRLPLARTEWEAKGTETRPGIWLSPGDAVEWDLPAGPARRLEGGYDSSLAGNPAGGLELSVSSGKGRASSWKAAVRLSFDAARWNRWSVVLPALPEQARLTLTYRDPNPEAPRSVFLTEPALLVEHQRPPRTIVVFLVDTLRADHVSGYGYSLSTTPNLDRYFAGWLRAQKCLPAANWTLPSHASLFLSESVAHHGVGRFGRMLPERVETLAATVGRAGFRTLAVTGGGFVDPAFGFARGFDRYAVLEKPASEAVAKALAMLDEHRDEPVFLFLHTYQVHDYAPEESVAKQMFGGLAALGPNWPASAGELASTRGNDPHFPAWIRARYDAALRCVDNAFGALLEGLQRSGRLSETAIVFTSDHGEALCSHQWKGECLGWTHGNPYLYEEELAVPLEIRIPWKPRARGALRNTASLLDVAPTLAEAVGVPAPGSFEGRSLLSGEPPAERTLATEAPPLDAVAVRAGPYKLIRRVGVLQEAWFGKSTYRVLPPEECLDLERDPHEVRPSGCGSAWGRAMQERTDRYLAEAFPDSVVLRVPARAEGVPGQAMAVRVRARGGPPALRTFGLAGREVHLEQQGSSTSVRFSIGLAPVWLAFEPPAGSRAAEVDVEGPGAPVTAAGGSAGNLTRAWNDLGWPSGSPLPEALTAFTTPPSLRFATDASPLPNEVVTRLLALGYLRGSPELAPSLQGAGAAPGVDEPPLPDGQVRILHGNAP